MISAGNDIVALNVIDKQRTRLPAFYSKFITPPELALYRPGDISFENFVWLIWSVKESAYKYLKRFEADLVFSPSRIVVEQLSVVEPVQEINLYTDIPVSSWYNGKLRFKNNLLASSTIINEEFIASVIKNNSSLLHWGVQTIRSTDHDGRSRSVRAFAVDKLQELYPNDKLGFSKSEAGYPVLTINDRSVDLSISFAHHDRYVSYSFQFPN